MPGPAAVFSAIVLTIAMVEIGARLPLVSPAARMREAVATSTATMARRGVSDHWKQIVLLHSACITFRAASLVLGAVALLGVVATAGVIAIGQVVPDFDHFTFSAPGLALIFAFALVYLPLRNRLWRLTTGLGHGH